MSARTLRIRYESREAFARAWQDSLSRGAVFVHVDDPPPLQACVNVALELTFAGAKASLEGEVVQHVPPAAGAGAGVAVHLLAPLAKIRGAFERFLADEEPLVLDQPLEEEGAEGQPAPPASPPAAATNLDPDAISDADLAAVLGGEGAPRSARAGEPGHPSAANEPGARLLDPSDPFAQFDPHARILEESDPEPEADRSALPPEGVAYDPHEIDLE